MAGLQEFLSDFGLAALLGAVAAMALGGFIKGVVGFALPVIALSTMGSFLPYDTSLGLLIVPTLVANLLLGLRNGLNAAADSLLKYWRLNLTLIVMIIFSAQLVPVLPSWILFAVLGAFTTLFGVVQIAGWQLRIRPGDEAVSETATGLIAGFFGGISGVWGPPVVMYLLARHVEKSEMVRVQSLCYLAGALVLMAAHLHSGVFNAVTAPVSALLAIPTMAAMLFGYRVQDRLDQSLFRRITLLVLMLAGLNLLRRAFFG